MLPEELIKKIKKIHIRSSRMVDTMMAGQYRSVFRGSGIEFEEVREYSPGDDVKNIDWKVSARMGRPYVKLYREERELVLMLLVDMSASGRFGTSDGLKQEKATEVASILAFNAIRNNDKVGAILFTDRVERYIPPNKGSSHVWRVIKEILAFQPKQTGTDIASALQFLGSVARKKTISFLVSDFIAPDCRRDLAIVSRRHELIAVLVTDPGELDLPEGGIITFRDLETGQLILLDASNRKMRRQYKQKAREVHLRKLERVKAAGLDLVELKTDVSVIDTLTRYFRYREQRIRQ